MAHGGPPFTTHFAEKGFGAISMTEATTPPITQPTHANASQDETPYRLNTHHTGSPKINSAAYAKGNVYTISTVRVDGRSIGAKVLLVTPVHKAKNIGTTSGANTKA
jgi:hypothetical protein